MKKSLFIFLLLSTFATSSFGQTYWNFIMDTCSVNSSPSGSFLKNGKLFNVIQEGAFQGVNHLRIVGWDDQLVREELNTSIQYNEYTKGNFQGIIRTHNGYLLENENSHFPLINFDDNLQVRWSINLKDSLNATDGIPVWWCEDTLSGNLYSAGSYSYPNNYQCSTIELNLTKLDSLGNIIFTRKYPGIFQNSPNGYLYDYASTNYIGIVNNEVHVSGSAMQFYPGTTSVFGSKLFFAKFDMNGNLLSLNFMGDKSAYSWVLNDGIGYYIVREEALSEYSLTLSKMQVYHKADIDAEPVLLFEDPYALPQISWQLYKPIMTDQGILLLNDHSNNQSLGAKLIMFDTSTNTIAWQKSYVLDIDSSTVNISSTMGNMGYLVEMPDHGFAFSGNVLTNNIVLPWYIRTDACGDVVYSGCTISGVEEQASKKDVELIGYPNPFTNSLTLQFNSRELPTSIQIFNSVGQVVRTEAVNGRQQLTLNTESLATGVYIVRAADSSLTATFVKE